MDEDVKSYVEAVSDERLGLFKQVEGLIESLYPNAVARIWHTMPTWKSGEGWVSLAYVKDGVTMYTDNASEIAGFKAKHRGFSSRRGILRFKVGDAIPEDDLKHLIRRVVDRTGKRYGPKWRKE